MGRAKYSEILKDLEDLEEEEAILKIELNRDFLFEWADKALIRTALGYEPEQIDLMIEKALSELLSRETKP